MSLMRMIVKVGIDATEYTIGLKRLESGFASLGKKISDTFTKEAVMQIAKEISNIADLADQLEITTKQVQELQVAAANGGIAFDALASALGKIKKIQAEGASGDGKATALMDRLGFNKDEQPYDVLKRIGFTEDKAALFDLLGVKSARIHSTLKDIKSLGPMEFISDKQIKALDDLERKWERLKMMAKIVATGALDRGGMLGMGIEANKPLFEKIKEFFNPKTTPHGESLRTGGASFGRLREMEGEGAVVMPEGYTKKGRSSGWAGPRQLVSGFSPIELGDRANVGGFFGPNADINRRMQQNIESMNKEIKAISGVVVGAAQTAP